MVALVVLLVPNHMRCGPGLLGAFNFGAFLVNKELLGGSWLAEIRVQQPSLYFNAYTRSWERAAIVLDSDIQYWQ
jgi:hypothetical protein